MKKDRRKGRTLTNSERSALEVIFRLQDLGAVPKASWDYEELGRVSERHSDADKEGIAEKPTDQNHRPAYCSGDPLLIQNRKAIFRWTHLGIDVEIRLKRIVNVRYAQHNNIEWFKNAEWVLWLPTSLEIRGNFKRYLGGAEIERAHIILEGYVSVNAFLRLATGEKLGSFF